jgi:hypothetical protein
LLFFRAVVPGRWRLAGGFHSRRNGSPAGRRRSQIKTNPNCTENAELQVARENFILVA